LLAFWQLILLKSKVRTKYSSSLDSNGKIAMTSYYAQDTNALLQTFVVTRINGQIDLLTWTTKLHSFMMDRQQVIGLSTWKRVSYEYQREQLMGFP